MKGNRWSANAKSLEITYKSIRSLTDNSFPALLTTSNTNRAKFEQQQRDIARMILSLPRRSSTANLLETANLQTIQERSSKFLETFFLAILAA